MEIVFENIDDKVVFSVIGRLDTSNYEIASEKINEKIDGGALMMVADLSKMDYISSSGLRVFLSVLKKLKAAGGNIALCGIQPKIKEVFEISGFNSLFIITDTKEEALSKL